LLVLADADLDAAVQAAAFGAYFNQGQICMSTERIIVDDSVADEFVAKLTAKAMTLRAGNPQDASSILASMVSKEAADRLRSLIEGAVKQGATLSVGGTIEGAVAQATLLDKVTPAMRIYREESFGPVVSVVRVHGDDEAIAVANDTEYGLSAAIFSKDVARALRLASRIQSGICHINGPTVHDEAQMPFGGVRASGYGRFGGKAAVDEFTELRWITIQTTPRHYPI
jgi:acyl-CoA reductase-like NAD-dependent aldehyde dehydrogenase